ncbi:hypothetical protein LTR41_011508 [Exophiala xenobiotica]|nr:hypothetical protein LTR41_011508 [Exophiala xenobiotica]KAK5357357.1 hypothetical protein LTR11_011448 [Exophiala xenobiotica]KAK5550672.1 hypothetical protein LTR46_011323 [Exophiala xenobiotica]
MQRNHASLNWLSIVVFVALELGGGVTITTATTTTTIGDTETATTSTLSASTSNTQTASSGSDYMAIVEKWSSKGGLSALDKDSALESNALKTSTDSVGGLIHELNPGTMAQVLAPGNPDNF